MDTETVAALALAPIFAATDGAGNPVRNFATAAATEETIDAMTENGGGTIGATTAANAAAISATSSPIGTPLAKIVDAWPNAAFAAATLD